MVELKVKENAGYEIISQIALDKDLFVLGKLENSTGTMYVTWTSSDGKSFYHGHYFHNDYEAALQDMFERAGYVQKTNKTPSQMLEDEGYFWIVMWSDEDLAAALEYKLVEPTKENIEILKGLVWGNKLREFMIERGWDYLYELVDNSGLVDDEDDNEEEE